MENGMGYNQVGTFGLSDLILSRGLGAYGYGGYGYGGSYLRELSHADGTAVKQAVAGNSVRIGDSLDRITAQNKEQRDNFIFQQITKAITDQEFRNGDRLRDLERMINDNARDAAKCCCETQALIISEATKTRELMQAIDAKNITRELDAAQARITQLETINALKDNGYHHGVK